MNGCSSFPGTCGELFQGLLNGQPCLVSCPIDWYARAEVHLDDDSSEWRGPPDCSKALQALRAGAAEMDLKHGGGLHIVSDLPRGRGYGSSTADIGAALSALSRAVGGAISPAQTARIATSIEPSDSTLFPGLALFAHREGKLLAALGAAPPLRVLVLDPGGEVDTLAYNREVTPHSLQRFAARHREAFSTLHAGLAESDWGLVGRAATLSAQIQQAVVFNPLFERALTACQALGGLGVCRAHSGTILGILLDPARDDAHEALEHAGAHLPGKVELRLRILVGGGARQTGRSA